MAESYTHYLSISQIAHFTFQVSLSDSFPEPLICGGIKNSIDFRYSPIFLVYLPSSAPQQINSITFIFSSTPYKALGALRTKISEDEKRLVYFSLGLASIIFINFKKEKTKELFDNVEDVDIEYWELGNNGIFDSRKTQITRKMFSISVLELPEPIDDSSISVYIEQIYSSIIVLNNEYSKYYPEEIKTLQQVMKTTSWLIRKYKELYQADNTITNQIQLNSIVAPLVEISAALSYAVTQGVSGIPPILSNRSPFPHHSLLGIGGSVRAITKFTRYLEDAFVSRSASKVIFQQYNSNCGKNLPFNINDYSSGEQYKFQNFIESFQKSQECELFDSGGDFYEDDFFPLIAYFSLRHGFMESKFSVTVASESLTYEASPQWTLITLSHEIMHSRVRQILQALFGGEWDGGGSLQIDIRDFDEWHNGITNQKLEKQIKNVILNFCIVVDNLEKGRVDLEYIYIQEAYNNQRHIVREMFVHFHDYFFTYACQPELFIMSLWGTWIQIAAPYVKKKEYLVRTLATVACGTGLAPRAAFSFAKDKFFDAIDNLEYSGVSSPLFDILKNMLNEENEEDVFTLFKPCYYLVDQVRLCFASSNIAKNIDRLESDDFAEGSTLVDNYCHNIHVFGEQNGQIISPVRYILASLYKILNNSHEVKDARWLSAWNMMVISSQEFDKC